VQKKGRIKVFSPHISTLVQKVTEKRGDQGLEWGGVRREGGEKPEENKMRGDQVNLENTSDGKKERSSERFWAVANLLQQRKLSEGGRGGGW